MDRVLAEHGERRTQLVKDGPDPAAHDRDDRGGMHHAHLPQRLKTAEELGEALAMIDRGELIDAKSIAALFHASRWTPRARDADMK